MKKMVLVMFDREGYTSRLADYLSQRESLMMDVRLFTNALSLIHFLQGHKVEMLIVGENDREQIAECRKNIRHIVLLSDGDCVREGSEDAVIFKYQSAESIVRELLELIAEDDGIRLDNQKLLNKAAEFIGVYSPFGGAGVSSFSRKLAKEYSIQCRTLYISLELLNGMQRIETGQKKLLAETAGRGMSELIFFLKQQKEKVALKLQSLVRIQDGVEYIRPVEDYRDLYSMDKKDLRRLLEVLAEEVEYEKVIFDIGCLSDVILELMRHCDVLYLPSADYPVQVSKEAAFEQLLQREGMEELIPQIKFVRMGDREGV